MNEAHVQDDRVATGESGLKSPFPAFGGKSRVAGEVWLRLDGEPGEMGYDPCRNYVEPFCFSAAMLLKRRPWGPGAIETINDRNAFVANFWRAVKMDPDAVADHADWPVNEVDLHARHRWLVGSADAAARLDRVREDPDAYDARIAGWWCWGACCWIGSGWCDERSAPRGEEAEEAWKSEHDHRGASVQVPILPAVQGVNGGAEEPPTPHKLPHLDAAGRGVQGLAMGQGEQLPHLDAAPGVAGPNERRIAIAQDGWGINAARSLGDAGHEKRPVISADGSEFGRGVHGSMGRVQLADGGRGVNGHDAASACGMRAAWVRSWMRRLSDRLRPVRVCCGHWDRICDSPSTMTRLGTTGVFLDPPYRVTLACGKANRTRHIYANDKLQDVNGLCDEVQAWCLKWGGNKEVRIALCGLEGEYPEIDKLLGDRGGWSVLAWKSNGGYGNRKGDGSENENARRERVWFSPHCIRPGEHGGLFT